MIVGIFIGFFSKGLIDKTFIEESSYLILLIIFAIILILGELAIESWRIKKYNELKREIEENKLHEKIKLRPIKC
jgi:undecaprenyl pyrophosphate phosphatase UppP